MRYLCLQFMYVWQRGRPPLFLSTTPYYYCYYVIMKMKILLRRETVINGRLYEFRIGFPTLFKYRNIDFLHSSPPSISYPRHPYHSPRKDDTFLVMTHRELNPCPAACVHHIYNHLTLLSYLSSTLPYMLTDTPLFSPLLLSYTPHLP